MNEMAFYNDNYFDINFKKYHPNDNSLVCQNNTLYYYGPTKQIYGMIQVLENERINLDQFKVFNMNVDQWQMEPHQIFFYIRETIKLIGIDIKENIMNIYKTASKNFIEESDKISLSYTIDYYNALKTIDNHLSGSLFDAYRYIKDMFTSINSMRTSDITPGFRFMYEKVFGEIKNDTNNENSSSNVNGNARTRFTGPASHSKITPLYQDITTDNENPKINNAAFISIVALVILIVAIVLGAMTYIFS